MKIRLMQDGLSYSLVAITSKNITKWLDFISLRLQKLENFISHDKKCQELAANMHLIKAQYGETEVAFKRAEEIAKSYTKSHKLFDSMEALQLCHVALTQFQDDKSVEKYIAYVESLDGGCQFGDNIELMVSVTTSKKATFSTHMGIVRPWFEREVQYPDLSIKLQSFAAKSISLTCNKAEYMINYPTDFFRKKISESLSKIGEKHYKGCSKQEAKEHFWKDSPLLEQASADAFKVKLSSLAKLNNLDDFCLQNIIILDPDIYQQILCSGIVAGLDVL